MAPEGKTAAAVAAAVASFLFICPYQTVCALSASLFFFFLVSFFFPPKKKKLYETPERASSFPITTTHSIQFSSGSKLHFLTFLGRALNYTFYGILSYPTEKKKTSFIYRTDPSI